METVTKDDLIQLRADIASDVLTALEESEGSKTGIDPANILSQNEAAAFLNVAVTTLIRWKKKGKIPYHLIGGSVIYLKHELDNLLRA